MPVSDISPANQDYLKSIWSLQEWTGEPVTVTALAERLGVRTSSASDGVKKLAEAGLVEHETYGGITLTPEGRHHAVVMVRRHRLLETYLVSELGYSWDEVHDEAEVLEHAVSERLIAAIDARLGHPTRDPHGDPIPSADGAEHRPDAVVLSDASLGRYVICRISDADPELLRDFAAAGITLDARVTVGESGAIKTDDGALIAPADAAAIWVVRV